MAWEEPYHSLLIAGHVLCYQPACYNCFHLARLSLHLWLPKFGLGAGNVTVPQPGIITISARSSDAKLCVKQTYFWQTLVISVILRGDADKSLARHTSRCRRTARRALATQKKLAYLSFQLLDHPPYSPDLPPSDYHLFPGLKKTIERSPFFVRHTSHCCHGDLVGRTTFCNFFFLSGLQKLEQRAKKCIELRAEYVE